MSNHGLARNLDNEPVCLCGYRPEILDNLAPIGKQWKAKKIVIDHVTALNPTPAYALRSPDAPFRSMEDAKYPRAGVRLRADGQWIITLWDEEGVAHAWEHRANAEHPTRLEAFNYAQWFIKSHRDVGVRLNGMEAA